MDDQMILALWRFWSAREHGTRFLDPMPYHVRMFRKWLGSSYEDADDFLPEISTTRVLDEYWRQEGKPRVVPSWLDDPLCTYRECGEVNPLVPLPDAPVTDDTDSSKRKLSWEVVDEEYGGLRRIFRYLTGRR